MLSSVCMCVLICPYFTSRTEIFNNTIKVTVLLRATERFMWIWSCFWECWIVFVCPLFVSLVTTQKIVNTMLSIHIRISFFQSLMKSRQRLWCWFSSDGVWLVQAYWNKSLHFPYVLLFSLFLTLFHTHTHTRSKLTHELFEFWRECTIKEWTSVNITFHSSVFNLMIPL